MREARFPCPGKTGGYAIGTDAIVTTLEDEVKEAFQSVEADME